MYRPDRMSFGIFLAPFHALGENPTLSLARDLELVEHLDRLGFDEAWVGEHHSVGREIIGDPAVFIAYAAARTRQIRLGTGVVSLPYHHPLIVADRMVQLDHMTRGRVMLGVGPGALASDAYMMGLDAVQQRRKMNESLDAIMRLLAADGPVSMETDWFTLREAQLQLPSYTRPHLPVAVASIFTPSGPTAAGRHGVGILSVGGFDRDGFARTWQWAEEAAKEAGKRVDRADWRVVAPVHVAETRGQAVRDVSEGFRQRAYYGDHGRRQEGGGGTNIVGAALGLEGDHIEEAIERGAVIVGSPDDACEAIEGVLDRSGGFGGFMALAHEWATPDRTVRSFELLMRHVAPHFQGLLPPLKASAAWVEANGAAIYGTQGEAFRSAFTDADRAIPDVVRKGLGG